MHDISLCSVGITRQIYPRQSKDMRTFEGTAQLKGTSPEAAYARSCLFRQQITGSHPGSQCQRDLAFSSPGVNV